MLMECFNHGTENLHLGNWSILLKKKFSSCCDVCCLSMSCDGEERQATTFLEAYKQSLDVFSGSPWRIVLHSIVPTVTICKPQRR